jgi:rifampicin phosphotransferase
MAQVQGNSHLVFEPPGPGSWLLDAVHMPRAFSRYHGALFPSAMFAGFNDCCVRYGLLLDGLQYRMVNGLGYFQVVPARPDSVPERFDKAEQALNSKLWRSDLERWDQEVKPAAVKKHLALQAIDPAKLSGEELAKHIECCTEHLSHMVKQHHTFNAAAMLPVGDFIASVSEWTGLPPSAFMPVLRGFSPVSAGHSDELDTLVAAIRTNPQANALLESSVEPGEILGRLRSQPGDVGAAATAYLDIVSYRLLDSLDLGDATAIEVPEVLVNGLRMAVDKGAPDSSHTATAEVVKLRERVPEEHRAAFDSLLEEARHMSRMRDERGLYSDVWAAGIARHALLELGKRLVAQGRLHEAAHIVDCDPDEVRALQAGSASPTADELAERADDRASLHASDAPPFLGEPPHGPPPLDGLPPAVARLMRAMGTAVGSLFEPSQAVSDAKTVRGTSASPGTYTGIARVINGPAEFGRLKQGDVLVTATTTEAFNIVLPLIGALVTDTGGLLSHSAIVSREYGIPGVVGCKVATSQIKDGARVTVNGTTGEITLAEA